MGNRTDFVQWNGYCQFLLDYPTRSARYGLTGPLGKEAFEDYYLSQIISFFLAREGREPAHATVVTDGSCSLALLGDGGAGKSSMAAALMSAGWKLITDDLAMFDLRIGSVRVHPGIPRLKLFPNTASSFRPRKATLNSARKLSSKLIFHLDFESYWSNIATLDCFVVLQRAPKGSLVHPWIRRAGKREAFSYLLQSSYNPLGFDRERRIRHFRFIADLARLVPTLIFHYGSGIERLVDAAECLSRASRSTN